MFKFEEKVYKKNIKQDENLILVGDIGGTTSRFAVASLKDKKIDLILSLTIESKKIKDFSKTINQVLEYLQNKYKIIIKTASIAAAGKVSKNRSVLELTNLKINLDSKIILKQTSLKTIFLLNDYEAASYGLLNLSKKDFIQINNPSIMSKTKKKEKHTKVVIGAGTGLGQGILIWNHSMSGGKYIACPSEGGHGDFATQNQEELDLICFIKKTKRIKKEINIEWEDLVSGKGIQSIYKFLEKKYKPTKYSVIIKSNKCDPVLISKYRTKDLISKKTFELFSKFYARYAKNFALSTLASGGVYIVGKIATENIDIFKNKIFLKEFINNYKLGNFLSATPLFVVTNYDLGLSGAAYFAKVEIE